MQETPPDAPPHLPTRPTISIVINNYNYARYLDECIQSCLSQSLAGVETICVDDGSTDESRSIIARYPTIRAILKENGGQTSAIRAGLAAARGDVVIFLDSDDALLPEACARVVEAWRPGAACLQYRLQVFDAASPNLGSLPSAPLLAAGHRQYLLRWGRFPYPPTSGNAFDRRVAAEILEVTKHDERTNFDEVLAMCAPFRGEVLSLTARLGRYRIHKENWSWRNTLKQLYEKECQFDEEIRAFAEHVGMPIPERTLLGTPYHYQKGLRLYLSGEIEGSGAARSLAANMVRAFLFVPRVPLHSRLKNLAAALMVLLSPRLARVVLRSRSPYRPAPYNPM